MNYRQVVHFAVKKVDGSGGGDYCDQRDGDGAFGALTDPPSWFDDVFAL